MNLLPNVPFQTKDGWFSVDENGMTYPLIGMEQLAAIFAQDGKPLEFKPPVTDKENYDRR